MSSFRVALFAACIGLFTVYRYEIIMATSSSENLFVQRLLTWCMPLSTDVRALRVQFALAFDLLSDAWDATHQLLPHIEQRTVMLTTRDNAQLPMMFYRRRQQSSSNQQRLLPCMLHLHMGWFKLRASDKAQASFAQHIVTALANADADAVFVDLFYRLTPEHAFPAALHDAQDALRYLVANAVELNIDKRRIIVAGESAGGNLALTLALADSAVDRYLAAAVAVIPVADMSPGWNQTQSYEQYVTYGFSHELNNFAVDIYCSRRNQCNTR